MRRPRQRTARPRHRGGDAASPLAFLRAAPDLAVDEETRTAAQEGLTLLRARLQRLADAGLVGGRDVVVATAQFNALCQGMAATELRNPSFLGPDPAAAWESAFEALLSGFARSGERKIAR